MEMEGKMRTGKGKAVKGKRWQHSDAGVGECRQEEGSMRTHLKKRAG